jgi:geranylgeranyl pyrophosphate synthase
MPLPAGVEHRLRDSLLYVLAAPGNLARPQIVLHMYAAYGQPIEPAEDLAIALEYFHTASLLLDDLPCMDDAAERRGVPCVHLAFGEAEAVLAALALINRGYALLWKSVADAPRDRQAVGLEYVEQRLGVDGLLNGQSLDLHYAALPHDLRTSERIALGKTVSLIRLALVLPAILGGAPAAELILLERIALFWGLSYQILDDLKDVLETSESSGKTAARDAALDRPNIALILGVPAALERLTRLIGLGERSLRRAVRTRPSLAFLAALRKDLEHKIGSITEITRTPEMQEQA